MTRALQEPAIPETKELKEVPSLSVPLRGETAVLRLPGVTVPVSVICPELPGVTMGWERVPFCRVPMIMVVVEVEVEVVGCTVVTTVVGMVVEIVVSSTVVVVVVLVVV